MRANIFRQDTGVLLGEVELQIDGAFTGERTSFVAIAPQSQANVPSEAAACGGYVILETAEGVRYLASPRKATTRGGEAALTGTILGSEE